MRGDPFVAAVIECHERGTEVDAGAGEIRAHINVRHCRSLGRPPRQNQPRGASRREGEKD